jgi:polysaccharide export outer membrane protein
MRSLRNYITNTLSSSLVLVLMLCSCKTENLFSRPPKEGTIPEGNFNKTTDNYNYIIRKDDKINLGVWNNDDLSVGFVFGQINSGVDQGKWLLVDGNGEIPVPKIGNLKVEGLTIVQAKKMIATALSQTIQSPIVDLKVLNMEVTVLGEVKLPGKVHLDKEKNTLVEVLGFAGDFDFYGDKKKIQVIRSVDNKPQSVTLDLTNLDSLSANNILVHPGDIVYVRAKKRKAWDKTAYSTVIPAASAVTAILLIIKTFF